VEVNRRNWDERVRIHLASSFYDVEGFVAGKPSVEPFEVDELGPLGGLRLAHLQCHFGLDTLDLVRLHPDLAAVGLDFSPASITAASDLADSLGLADRASFVLADVRSAASALGAGRFDVVYTGKGAVAWLPDLDRWAAECFALLKPGGFFYLAEFHPLVNALSQSSPAVTKDYFRTEPWVDDKPGTYADLDAPTVHNVSVRWNHPLPSVFSAVLGAGFELRFFHEWEYTLFAATEWLVRDGQRWDWPAASSAAGDPTERPRLPLMYSLKAYKPAG
jgi:SAM-dependent methyltransferase